MIEQLKEESYDVVENVKSRDFYRVYRYGKSKIIDGIRVDNKLNILTNKINTIVNRDEENDVFEIANCKFHKHSMVEISEFPYFEKKVS